MVVVKVILGTLLISWVFIIYEIITAPVCDEYGNIINKDKKQKQKQK
tara:strand:+ start:167 stop:307 length:141 start_codon:yes stop_codon:yes gene_type:complete